MKSTGEHLQELKNSTQCVHSTQSRTANAWNDALAKAENEIENHIQNLFKSGSYHFVQNTDCRFFPHEDNDNACHPAANPNNFNCLFCFCPLYHFTDCGGNYKILDDGTKDCSDCLLPHREENYDLIIRKLQEDHQAERNYQVQRILQDLLSETENCKDVEPLINVYVDRLMEVM